MTKQFERNFRKGLRRRLERISDLSCCTCGHEMEIAKLDAYIKETEDWVVGQLESIEILSGNGYSI